MEGVCVMCVWDKGGTLKGSSTVAKCSLQADPLTLTPTALHSEVSGPQGM